MNTLDRLVRVGLWLVLPLLAAAVLPAQIVSPTPGVHVTPTPRALRPGPVLCYDDLTPPEVIAVDLTANDGTNIIYQRTAYVFYGPIRWVGVPRKLVARDVISITRWLREDGERCNLAATKIVENGFYSVDYCGEPK